MDFALGSLLQGRDRHLQKAFKSLTKASKEQRVTPTLTTKTKNILHSHQIQFQRDVKECEIRQPNKQITLRLFVFQNLKKSIKNV